jgi:hypothetical protein
LGIEGADHCVQKNQVTMERTPGTELDLSHAIKMAIGDFDISMLLDAEVFNPSPCVRSNPTVPGKCRSNGGAAIGPRTCLACKKHDRDRQRRTRERRRKRTGGLAESTTVVVTPSLLRSASISQMHTALQEGQWQTTVHKHAMGSQMR